MKFELGEILKPQGIKGEVKVRPLSNPEFLKSVELVNVGERELKIVGCSIRDGYAYIKFENCLDRDMAESLRGQVISTQKENLPDLDEGQFFYEDLIDCNIFDENGKQIGTIIDIENYGSSDIFVIKQGFRTIDCPFVDGVFTSIDTKNKKIILDSKRFKEVTDYED